MIGAVLATVVYGSLLEWFVHGIAFHRWFARLHAPHHAEFRGARFQQPGPYRNLQRWWLELAAIGTHAPAFVLLGVRFGGEVAVTAGIALAAYAAASNFLHTSIHCPNGRLIERTAWHHRLVAYHREHHRHAWVNFSVPTQIGDRIMGSFRAPAATPDRSFARRA
jgi:hypothetical protein